MRRRIQSLAGSYIILAAGLSLAFGPTPAAAAPPALACTTAQAAECAAYCDYMGFDFGKCSSTGCTCFNQSCGDGTQRC